MKRKSDKIFLSHIGRKGQLQMVDVSDKDVTVREAEASAIVSMREEVLDALMGNELPKGDALSAARVAGILAAKRTGELIPLCHPLPVDWIDIRYDRKTRAKLLVSCVARTAARTGVEMEALVGASTAALTIYDMAKSADKRIVIGPVQLERKTGGKSGEFKRQGKSR